MGFELSGRPKEEAEIIGRELQRMAERHQVDGIRSLDPEEVLTEIHGNKSHPLRFLYDNFENIDAAAWAHWVSVTRDTLRGIKVVTFSYRDPNPLTKMQMYLAVKAPTPTDPKYRMRRVLRADVLKSDPMYAAVMSRMIRQIKDALVQLEQLVSGRTAPKAESDLVIGLRRELEKYYNTK